MVVAQLGRMGRSRTEPPEAHIYFTTLMYAGWAVPARAYGTRPEDWRSDLEHTYFSEPAPSDPKVKRTSVFRRSDGAGSDAAEHPSNCFCLLLTLTRRVSRKSRNRPTATTYCWLHASTSHTRRRSVALQVQSTCHQEPYALALSGTMPLARLLLLALCQTTLARRIQHVSFVGARPAAPRVVGTNLRSIALRRPRLSNSLRLAALAGLLYESRESLLNDAGCTAGAALGAVAWIKVWTTLADREIIDAKLARKIVHCGSGPLYLLVWKFYSDAALARFVAAIVPALNIAKLQRASESDNELTRAISRSGDPLEALGGPYLYTWVLLLAALLAFRTPSAVVAVAQMSAGDGLADIVGRRFGRRKWFCSGANADKSYAGSLGFVVGATAASVGLLTWLGFAAPVPGLLGISCVCALVEVFVPGVDDNISVPAVGALLALALPL